MKNFILKYFFALLLALGCLFNSTQVFGAINFTANTTGVTVQTTIYDGQTDVVILGTQLSNTSGSAVTINNANIIFNSSLANLPSAYFTSFKIYGSSSNNFAGATQLNGSAPYQSGTDLTFQTSSNITIAGSGSYYIWLVVSPSYANYVTLPQSFTIDFKQIFSYSPSVSYTNASGSTSKTYTLNTGSVSLAGNNVGSGVNPGPISYGQTSLVLFSFSITVQGNVTITSMFIPSNVNAGAYFTNGQLYRSATSNFSGAVPVAGSFNFNNGQSGVGVTGVNEVFTATSSTTYYYFMVADFTASTSYTAPATIQYNFVSGQSAGGPALTDSKTHTYNTFTTTDGLSMAIAGTYCWVGSASTNINEAGNYRSPNNSGVGTGALPANSAVQFGTLALQYPNYQPTVSSSISFSTITFGSNNAPTLTINTGATLTASQGIIVNANAAPTITGAGTAAITAPASFVTGTGSTTTLSVPVTLTGGTTGVLDNAGTINSSGTGPIGSITAAAPSSNSGTIALTGSAALIFSSTLDNTGGTITKGSTGLVSFNGAVTNGTGGTITQNNASGLMRFFSTLDNSGTVTQSAAGGITFSGTVTNNSTGIINQSGTTGTMTFTLTPANTGNINQTAAGDLTFNAALTNAGTITRSGTGAFTLTSNTTNSGTIIQNGSTGLMNFPGTVNNTGTITQGSAGAGGVTFTGVITNSSSGIINQSATSGAMTFSATTGQANAGTINQTNAGTITFSGALSNSGSIIQSNTGTGTLGVTGVLANTGTITKNGTGAFTFTATGATNSSTGTITNGNATGGITFSNGFTNSGALKPTTGPITVSGAFSNASTGVITLGSGLLTLGSTTSSNAGSITGSGSIDINSTTSFTNSGSVTLSGGAVTIASPTFSNTSTGTFTSSGGAVTFDLAGAQAINNANTTTPITFFDLILSGGNTKTLNGSGTGKFKIASTGSIQLSTANTIFATGTANLTLNSDASGSATVKPLTLTGVSITGTVNAERYISGGQVYSRGYRLLSSPVGITANGALPNLTYLRNSAYLTGTGGSGNGFDVSGNPTLYFYRENLAPSSTSFTAGNYRGVGKINNTTASSFTIDVDNGPNTLPAGNGFLFFFRGNRATNATTSTTATADAVTLTSNGVLNQGNVVVSHWTGISGKLQYTGTGTGPTTNGAVRGFNLVGNPYASSIDWDLVTRSAVGTTIYVYNPKLKVYATYMAGGVGAGTNFNGPSGTADIIPSGQGFFVVASSNAAVLTFTEASKVNTQVTSTTLSLNSAADSLANLGRYLRIELYKDSLNKEDALVFFRNNTNTTFSLDEDAKYLKGNSIVNLSTRSSDNVNLAINQQAFPQTRQLIPLNVNITSNGTYQLNLPEIKNIPAMYDIWLLDNYKKDSLDVKSNPTYSFTASTADTNSFGARRFSLLLKPNASLTVHLLDFSGTKAENEVKLSWTVENEASYTRYILQRSIDGGKNFTTLDSLTSANLGVYNDLDPNPVKGQNLYRLKQIDITGNISYSSIVPVMYADNIVNNLAANLLSVYPNPVQSTLNLAVTSASTEAPNYKITITNNIGIMVKSSTSNTSNWQGDVSTLVPGTYFIQVINIKNNTVTGKSTFIKL